ncbi:MAG: T9SS C-terminal target domain-containing protein [Calditrichaeota bacterium]|nr:MAG: T9SS C-terminal target domain-containing protein [Calditrichota bacterium]
MKNIIKTLLVLSLIIISCFKSIDAHPDDIYWDKGFDTPILAGHFFELQDVISYDGNIIYGGRFNDHYPMRNFQNVVSWDGYAFEDYGDGIYLWVKSMELYQNDLIIGGRNKRIIKWDGVSSEVVDSLLVQVVNDMAVWNDTLYGVGKVYIDDTTIVNGVVSYDGDAIVVLEYVFDDVIHNVAVYEDKLLIGGEFTTIDSLSYNKLAIYDGQYWSNFPDSVTHNVHHLIVTDSNLYAADSLGYVSVWDSLTGWQLLTTLDSAIYDMVLYDNKIIISTFHSQVDGNGSCIKYWDGFSWIDMGPNLYGYKNVFHVDNDSLYVMPYVKFDGDDYPKAVIQWKNNNWEVVNGNGLRDYSYLSCVHQNKLIVAGEFDYAGGKEANKIAMFDGEEWTSFGENNILNMPSLYSYGDSLLLGGWFDKIGGVQSNSAVLWDGSNVHAIGFDSVCQVVTLYKYKDTLFASGRLTVAGYEPNSIRLAKRVNDIWIPCDEQPNGAIGEYIEYKGNLIVAGDFDSIGTTEAINIALWNGISWEAITSSVELTYDDPEIFRLYNFHDTLYTVGRFHTINGVRAEGVARWDGSNWSSINNGNIVNPDSFTISDIALYGEEIIITGHFNTIGGVEAKNIASWDGETFSPLGSGISRDTVQNPWSLSLDLVSKLQIIDQDLYVVGDFLNAGDKFSCNIARWTKGFSTEIQDSISTELMLPEKIQLYQNYPNPFNPETEISYSLNSKSEVTLVVYNILGQKVQTLVDRTQPAGNYSIQWNGKGCASGVYFYQLTVDDFVDEKKMILLK